MKKRILKLILVVPAVIVLAGGIALTTSYLMARRTAAKFYQGSEAVAEPFRVSLSLSWWPAVEGASEFCEGRGLWEARACAKGNACCDLVGRICMSEAGKIVAMWPEDFEEQLALGIGFEARRELPNKPLQRTTPPQ
jgi:hypothetical protein